MTFPPSVQWRNTTRLVIWEIVKQWSRISPLSQGFCSELGWRKCDEAVFAHYKLPIHHSQQDGLGALEEWLHGVGFWRRCRWFRGFEFIVTSRIGRVRVAMASDSVSTLGAAWMFGWCADCGEIVHSSNGGCAGGATDARLNHSLSQTRISSVQVGRCHLSWCRGPTGVH